MNITDADAVGGSDHPRTRLQAAKEHCVRMNRRRRYAERHGRPKLSGDTIRFGAMVTLIDEDIGRDKVWQIVGEPEADANKGKISVASPVARALIGKSKGDTVEVEAPGGAKTYKVRKVEWLKNDPLK